MSRREGSGQSHIPPHVPEGPSRDRRQPSVHYSRYSDPIQPSPTNSRTDIPQYSPYPPPPVQVSYPPEPPRAETRHLGPQRYAQYRAPEQPAMYGRQEYYPSESVVAPGHQPAPRQRTAVACRYCRRRKIRCSGYQSSPDGRCTNCVQRDQKCEFLPVSAAPYDPPRPEAPPYLTSPQTASHVTSASHRLLPQQYAVATGPIYAHPPPYSPHEQRRVMTHPSQQATLSPPRKRPALDPLSTGKPVLAPLQTGATVRRRPASHEYGPGYLEGAVITPYSDYRPRSPPYSAAPSPHRRRSSQYSTATVTAPTSGVLSSSRGAIEMSPYPPTLPPPPPQTAVRSPRVTPGHTRRFSYQPQTPFSPEQGYSRPISQGRPPISPATHPLPPPPPPPPPLPYARSSPTSRYTSAPPRISAEHVERPLISPRRPYELHTESTHLPPLTHLNRGTPPLSSSTVAPALPSPIPISLPPLSGVITTASARNAQDSAILSAFDTVAVPPPTTATTTPSRTAGFKRKRTPTPDSPAEKS